MQVTASPVHATLSSAKKPASYPMIFYMNPLPIETFTEHLSSIYKGAIVCFEPVRNSPVTEKASFIRIAQL
jgi:hypothetical protein